MDKLFPSVAVVAVGWRTLNDWLWGRGLGSMAKMNQGNTYDHWGYP
jgi:hypothetical protein